MCNKDMLACYNNNNSMLLSSSNATNRNMNFW